ncbi:hypothetical protein KI440_02330 [Candidatus Saccharibacteria bacterium TM7i]|nr:hypothetical protein KI440_02330 [Candidatus Saccharibacteria bacterium TM7i]
MTKEKQGGKRKFIALALLSALVTSFFVVSGPVSGAEAHTGDITATAACNAGTGEYDVTYTLTLRNTPPGQTASTMWRIGSQNFQGTPNSAAGMDKGPISSAGNGQVVLGSHSLPGTTVGNGPWVYAYTKWSGGYGYGSDTRVEGLKGNCSKPFDWNWQYAAPTCDGLTVTYPADLPAGQANDVNIRVKNMETGEVRTFNFHNNTGTWSGTQTFDVKAHPDWPGWKYYEFQWTQVAGTNYHWQGSLICGTQKPPKPEPKVERTPKETVDCAANIVNIVITVKTSDPVWNEELYDWAYGEPVVTTEMSTRPLTDAERLQCAGDKPEPKVDVKTTEKVSCETELVTITKTTTTEVYVLDGTKWVLGEPDVKVETSDRPATIEELNKAECPPGTEPPPPVHEVDVKTSLDCTTETVTTTTTTTDILYVWNTETRTYVLGKPDVKVETSTRPATIEELNSAECDPTTPPEPKVKEEVTTVIDCATETATDTKVVTTIDPVWNAETRTWVDGEPKVESTDTVRPATVDELNGAPCDPSTPPPPVVNVTSKEVLDCTTKKVTTSTDVAESKPTWDVDTRTWVFGDPVVKTSVTQRDATAAEVKTCPATPSKNTPVPPKTTKSGLAVTGGETILPLVGGAAALILLGATLTILAVRRRRQNADA